MLLMLRKSDARIEADQTPIPQLFLNHLENADKYGQTVGRMSVTVESDENDQKPTSS